MQFWLCYKSLIVWFDVLGIEGNQKYNIQQHIVFGDVQTWLDFIKKHNRLNLKVHVIFKLERGLKRS